MTEHRPLKSLSFRSRGGGGAALRLARHYLDGRGHVATLPEIVDARIGDGVTRSLDDGFVTSASSEFAGLSKAGNPVVAVLHGAGPLIDPEGYDRAYDCPMTEFGRRTRDGGIVDRETFLRLLDDAHVVDLAAIVDLFNLDGGTLTAEAALSHPLLLARFDGGDRLGRYIECLRSENEVTRNPRARGEFLPMQIDLYDGDRYVDFADRSDGGTLVYVPRDFAGLDHAMAHLLTIGMTMQTGGSRDGKSYDSIQVEVSIQEATDGAHFVAVPDGGTLSCIAEAADHEDIVKSPIRRSKIWREPSSDATPKDIRPLVVVNEEFYAGRVDASPALAVRNIDYISRAVFEADADGSVSAAAEAGAPEKANAYLVDDRFERGSGPLKRGVRFYQARFDYARELMPMDEIRADRGLFSDLSFS